MKILPEHYLALKKMLLASYGAEAIAQKKRVYREDKLSETRFLFDLFYSIPFAQRQIWFDETIFYSYADDSHLETALRQAVKEIGAGK